MIRRILLASAGAMGLVGSAFAADLTPHPLPPPPPPPPMWTGFYIGINAGYEWAASTGINTASANVFSVPGLTGDIGGQVALLGTGVGSLDPNGFIGGGQIGYNYQFYNNFLVGLEADIDGIAGASKEVTFGQTGTVGELIPVPSSGFLDWSKSINYLGTVRGRLGWLFTPTLLVYGTGGLAYGGVSSHTGIIETLGYTDTPSPFGGFGTISNTRVGWTAGGGIEWMFLPNWSAKVEYLYYDLGSVSYNFAVPQSSDTVGLETIALSRTSTRFNGNVVRAGINYHFNWGAPAPVVAKY